MDTKAIVEALVTVQKIPIKTLEKKQDKLNDQSAVFSEVKSRFTALETKAKELNDEKTFLSYAATSSNESVIMAATTGDALPGTYEIQVNSLASEERTYSNAYASKTAAINIGTGTINLNDGTSNANITITAETTLSMVASAINTLGLNAVAGVVYDGSNYRLQISGTKSGSANGLTFTQSLSGGASSLTLTEVVAAANASITLEPSSGNSISITNSSNEITGVLPGSTLSLKSTGTSTVTVRSDPDAMLANVKELVDAWNQVNNKIRLESRYNPLPDAKQSVLVGDSTLRNIQLTMGLMVSAGLKGENTAVSPTTATFSGSYQVLRDVGIKLTETGSLSIDEGTFKEKVASNIDDFKKLFVSHTLTSGGNDYTVKSICEQMQNVASKYTDIVDGLLTAKIDGISKQTRMIDDDIADMQRDLVSYQKGLEKKFTRMETTMSELNSQSAYLMQLAMMPTGQ